MFFTMGANPNTCWIDGCVALDINGFTKTDPDLLPEDLGAACWPLLHQPYLRVTSFPRVFAIGDMCGRSIKEADEQKNL
jgi:thioredoxin reductase (NADPH)